MTFIDPEIAQGVGLLVGAMGGGYAAVKKWPFFKSQKSGAGSQKPEGKSNGGCPDPSCHNEVINTSRNVSELKLKFQRFEDDIFPKINGTAVDVAEIKGYIKGLHNSKD